MFLTICNLLHLLTYYEAQGPHQWCRLKMPVGGGMQCIHNHYIMIATMAVLFSRAVCFPFCSKPTCCQMWFSISVTMEDVLFKLASFILTRTLCILTPKCSILLMQQLTDSLNPPNIIIFHLQFGHIQGPNVNCLFYFLRFFPRCTDRYRYPLRITLFHCAGITITFFSFAVRTLISSCPVILYQHLLH